MASAKLDINYVASCPASVVNLGKNFLILAQFVSIIGQGYRSTVTYKTIIKIYSQLTVILVLN